MYSYLDERAHFSRQCFPLNQFEGMSFNLICGYQMILHVHFDYTFLNKLYDLIGHVNNCLNFHVLYWRILLCFHNVNGECLFKLADDDDRGQW